MNVTVGRWRSVGLLALVSCFQSSRYVNPDLEGSSVTLSAAQARVGEAVDVAVWVRRGDGAALPGLTVTVLAPGTVVTATAPTTDGAGRASASVVGLGSGVFTVSAQVSLADFSAVLSPRVPLTFVPQQGTSTALQAGQAGTLAVNLTAPGGAPFTGTLQFVSSDPRALLPADGPAAAGADGLQSFVDGITFYTAGEQTVTVRDAATGAVLAQRSVAVGAGPAAQCEVQLANGTWQAGVPGPLVVQVADAYGNAATGYAGTLQVASSDPAATLPGAYTFAGGEGGVHTFAAAILTQAGAQALRVSDVQNPALSCAATVMVAAGPATSLQISGPPAQVVAGTPLSATVVATDAYGNPASSYRGTVALRSSDPNAHLPPALGFGGASGTWAGSVQLTTAGAQTLRAADTGALGLVSAPLPIAVAPAAVAALALGGSGGAPITQPLPVTVTAVDAYGNRQPAYTGTVSFTCDDAGATLPGSTAMAAAAQGSTSVAVTLAHIGPHVLTATAGGGITGQQTLTGSTLQGALMYLQAGRCVTAVNGAAAGTMLFLDHCQGDLRQQWQFDGSGLLRNGTGLCLDANTTTADDTIARLQACNAGVASQVWQVDAGQKKISLQITSNQCLDLPNSNPTVGNSIGSHSCNVQQWGLGPPAHPVRAANNVALCLDTAGQGTAAGTPTQLAPCVGGPTQQWLPVAQQLRVGNLQCLTAIGGLVPGATTQLAPCLSLPAQAWTYDWAHQTFSSVVQPGLCLQAAAAAADGVLVQPCLDPGDPNLPAQQWLVAAQTIPLQSDSTLCVQADPAGNTARLGACAGDASFLWQFGDAQMQTAGDTCLTGVVTGTNLPTYLSPCSDGYLGQLATFDGTIIGFAQGFALRVNNDTAQAGTPMVLSGIPTDFAF